jgi:hypothetical protein
MTINTEVKEILREFDISLDDGLMYLLSIYYGYTPSYIPDSLKSRINRTKIIVRDDKGELKWNVSLFEGQETKFDWVATEWMPIFANLNPDRKGVKRTAISRMKKFFAKNPDYRKEDVMEATRMYAKSVDDTNYTVTSHYFIYKGVGAEKVSLLEEWCEKLDVARRSNAIRNSRSNTMR